jgi:hypothetical protein
MNTMWLIIGLGLAGVSFYFLYKTWKVLKTSGANTSLPLCTRPLVVCIVDFSRDNPEEYKCAALRHLQLNGIENPMMKAEGNVVVGDVLHYHKANATAEEAAAFASSASAAAMKVAARGIALFYRGEPAGIAQFAAMFTNRHCVLLYEGDAVRGFRYWGTQAK